MNSNMHQWKLLKILVSIYIQYGSNGDAYFKLLSTEKYIKEIKIRFTDIIEELRNTRSSWKIKMIMVMTVVFEDNNDDKKAIKKTICSYH